MSPARLAVRAVVVSDGHHARLAAVLDAVASQDPAPDAIELVLVNGAAVPDHLPSPAIAVHETDAPDFSRAVDSALERYEAGPGELLWLLHDDCAPLPGALALQLATARKRHRAGVIGACHVQWDDPTRLISMGATTTRWGARRMGLVEEGDVDQGQYDDRDDVLSVSISGALVRRELWDELGGLDPAYRGWSDSSDFCRRVWRSEWDVVVVPRAKVRHAQERLHGGRNHRQGRVSTYGARRASEWFAALVFAPWWMLLPLFIGSLLSSAGRVLLRVAQNDLSMVWADASVPFRVLATLPRVPRSRSRVRRCAVRGSAARAIERPLLATPRQVRHETRSREWGAYESWRAASTPPELIRTELATAARRRRVMLVGLIAALAAVSVVRHPDWLAGTVTGRMLASDVLGVTDLGWHDLWTRGLSGWTEQGLGAPSVDGALALVLLPLAFVPGGLAVGLALFMGLAPLWAGLGVWAAAGTVTRSRVVRALASVVYGLAPIAITSIDDGRVAAVLVHVALPWVVFGIMRGGGWQVGERIGDGDEYRVRLHPSPSAAAGAAVALAVVTVAAPVLVLPAVIVCGVVGLLARDVRNRMWAVAIPTVALGLPGLIAVVIQGTVTQDAWTVMAREPGPSAVSSESALDALLSAPATAAPQWLTWASVLLVPVVLALAALATVLNRRWVLATVMVGLAAGGVAVAAAVSATQLSPDDGLGTASANGWVGPGLSLVVAAAVIAVASASHRWWDAGTGSTRTVMRGVQMTAATVVGAVVVGHGVAVAWPVADRDGVSSVSTDVIPLVAALELDQPTRQRVLVLSDSDDALTATVMASDGTEVLSTAGELVGDGRPAARTTGTPVASIASLDTAIAGVVGGAEGAAADLAQWGIGVIVAAPGADRVASALAQSDALQLLGSSDRGTSWRLSRDGDDAPVSRAWVSTAQGATVIPMTRTGGSVDLDAEVAGTVVLAASADEGWKATLDGAALESVDDPMGRAAFAVDGQGRLELTYEDPAHTVWWWVGLIAVAWALMGSIPLPTRLFREARA